ncbi:MAG: arginine--tRNA ligase [Candidatus Levybacteria bacterium RIFOXYA1_FULL_41_10]|nr:MAG: Arginine-tRNA ligase [Candidatus Levybacteria bacterium GW2011_GWA1_39_34]KKR49628.1 MAG: hypothetical protein UT87_C0028G0003 [Candidatus Levybacteria bacterium GW2011_GWC1_40_19]KKR94301.1 MAG: Arginine-tRNA ligase [Candidatus Levybacteria bacterium GW2011_GWA2_41_15]KKS00532.1 MAG: Arginine-tRNA ligase [Candidatus Levybacteria bacterium GW2011_GWB1_41_21]OGH20572.1 MAG: arginine--tRNA ligase [Candidatus Levybacteria bacterium RIFCSPHIGHO2_01_FULL_40_83]OGH26557.1 MAG: arginine--tRNA
MWYNIFEMVSYAKDINAALSKVLSGLGVEKLPKGLIVSSDLEKGDYSTSVALKAANNAGKSPMDLAQEIADKLNKEHEIEAEVASPGFVNIKIPQSFFGSYLDSMLNGSEEIDLTTKSKSGKKIIVEYTDPNPFKEFHVGHMYSNAVGESIARLLEAQGAEVRRVCYQGDVGLHVAKAVWGMKKLMGEMPGEADDLSKKAVFLGKSYTEGSKAYEEEAFKKGIDSLNEKIYKNDKEVKKLYDLGKKWSLQYFDSLYKKLGTRFDKFYFESEAGGEGLKIVNENTPKVFKEDEGAIIFKGEEYGLHTRVFINSRGLPTYEAKELGLAPLKYKDFPYDTSIIITGNEINEYFKVLLKALSFITPDLADKTIHLSHGMVRLTSGKMSSRTGKVLTAEEILLDIKSKIKDKFDRVDEKSLSSISVGAAKYALLKSGIGKDIVFDVEESISLNGNSGPYLQYTYARTQSILSKKSASKANLPAVLAKEELNLLRNLVHFGEVVEEASETFSPSTLATYLFGLAQNFNLFYQKHKVIDSETEEFRLALVYSAGATLKRGLGLLGIEAPSRI